MASYSKLNVKEGKARIEKQETNEEAEDDTEEDDDSCDVSLYEGITEFHGEEPGDLSFKAGEVLSILSKRKDGWWTAENKKGKIGLVPSTYLELHLKSARLNKEDLDSDSSSDDEKPKNKSEVQNIARDLWNFCPSSLSKLENEDNRYTTSAFLHPKLSMSGLSFRDIHWDDASNNLKGNVVKCQRLITLTECRNMPETKKGLEISSYHIRMCLHDGSKVLSNIHTIRARSDSKDSKNWTFSSSVSQSGSYLEDGRIFIRTTNTTSTIGILFQPCLLYRIQDKKMRELSYGWAFMRLLDDSGNPVPNKSKALLVLGGHPFEETETVKQDERRLSKVLVSKDRYPSLMIRITTPDRDVRQQLKLFPDILIGSACLIPHISLYRQTLADCLLHQRRSSDSTELLYAPVESTFPKLFNQPDILDAFRKAWIEKIRNEKKSNKKDAEKLKQLFREVYKETAYLLINCSILPPYSFGNIQVEQARQKEIERLMQIRQTKGRFGILLAPNISCKPFSIHEAAMDIVGEYSMPFE